MCRRSRGRAPAAGPCTIGCSNHPGSPPRPCAHAAAAAGPLAANAEDPELIAVFLEEAREESAEDHAQALPAWDQDPGRWTMRW